MDRSQIDCRGGSTSTSPSICFTFKGASTHRSQGDDKGASNSTGASIHITLKGTSNQIDGRCAFTVTGPSDGGASVDRSQIDGRGASIWGNSDGSSSDESTNERVDGRAMGQTREPNLAMLSDNDDSSEGTTDETLPLHFPSEIQAGVASFLKAINSRNCVPASQQRRALLNACLH